MKNFLEEFKEFAMKGNVLDMAIGFIIGGAFGKIVTSLVTDIITPLISLLLGKVDLSNLGWTISQDITLNYGNFIQSGIDFLVISLSIFVAIRALNKINKKKETEEVAEVIEEPAADTVLLQEILQELKKSNR